MALTKLTTLEPREYEHPFDKKALDALERTKGLDTLVKKFYEYGIERIFQIQYTGSNLKVTPTSFPVIYDIVEESCEVLNLPLFPKIYIRRGDEIQGLITGVDTPLIVLTTATLDCLTDEEIRFVVGRLIGHIKSRHVLYYEIGFLLPVLSDLLAGPTMGIGSLITMGLHVALLRWMRMSEYTADRAGLLACQDVSVATSTLAKIAGLPDGLYDSFNVDDFVTQAREFEGFDESKYSKVLKYLSVTFDEQHWSVMRANELLKWIDAGSYKNVLDRKTEIRQTAETHPKFCPNCGTRLDQPVKFCPNCGNKLG